MRATASIVVDARLQQIVDFILDPNGYPQADTKILKQEILERTEDEVLVKTTGYMRWPVLRGSNVLKLTLKLPDRIDVESVGFSFPANLMQESFEASFEFEPAEGGIQVTHTEDFRLKGPGSGMLERAFGPWLERHLRDEEMPGLKRLVEARAREAS